MEARRILLYFAWSRPAETKAPLEVIDDRFPAIFELRRLFYPKLEQLSDRRNIDQGIAGFLDHVQKANFQAFADQTEELTSHKIIQVERIVDDGTISPLGELLSGVDTVVIISFDSFRTAQGATGEEVEVVNKFLDVPDHLVFVCPHHNIGETATHDPSDETQIAEYWHHGDHAIPPRQAFGGFACSLLAGLGVPVINRFGLKPATDSNGAPAPAEIDRNIDELGLLKDVAGFNLHPHLPHLERVGLSMDKMDVLARQSIDAAAPPHPFTLGGRHDFDAVLQSRPTTFKGKLWVCDTTLFSSMAGGVQNLRRLWANVVQRPRRA
jgi:hypothetical protein